ncbi:response regulator transcription factor [Sporichthya polymorpha]|uniref:response regulator transcription factor n=1 Tax=Sporichthya polymorpha TaxID=35751 RepID=UPI00036EE1DF|nr:helix-turn-helix transcriptional regulator [Sporichthya polymorpha]
MTSLALLLEQAAELRERAAAALAGGGRQDRAGRRRLTDALEDTTAKLAAVLRRPAAPGMDLGALGRALADLTRAGADLAEDAVSRRFAAVDRIHESLGRLRAIPDVGELLEAAAAELAHCCDLDRTVVSRRRGSTWRAEAVWISPGVDPDVAARTRAYLTEQWIPLRAGTLENDLVRRRCAALVSAQDAGVDRELVEAAESVGYIASPVMPSGEVIGFLQGDRWVGSRELTDHDRDNLWTFAEGFGLIFQHLVLSQRLDQQRAHLREAFVAAERNLAELSSAELLLARRERPRPAGTESTGPAGAVPMFSRREREVLELMVAGARNTDIAERLVISESTVKAHVSRVTHKLKAANRAEAVSRFLLLERGRAAAP